MHSRLRSSQPEYASIAEITGSFRSRLWPNSYRVVHNITKPVDHIASYETSSGLSPIRDVFVRNRESIVKWESAYRRKVA